MDFAVNHYLNICIAHTCPELGEASNCIAITILLHLICQTCPCAIGPVLLNYFVTILAMKIVEHNRQHLGHGGIWVQAHFAMIPTKWSYYSCVVGDM